MGWGGHVWPRLCPGPCREEQDPRQGAPLPLALKGTHRCIVSCNLGELGFKPCPWLTTQMSVRYNCRGSGGQRRSVCMKGTQDWDPIGKDGEVSRLPFLSQ